MREDGQLCFSSVSQLCPTLCDPMICSTPGLPVHHQLPEFTQTHADRVGDAIQPSHPLSSPSPPAPSPSQHQGLFQWVNSLHEVAKVLDSLYFWDFFCNWLLTKVFWFFFFFSFQYCLSGHPTLPCNVLKPLCWTVGWTWLPPWTSFLCHLFKGMYWRIWDGMSFSWLKDGPQ